MPAGPWASLPEKILTDRLDALMRADARTLAALRPPIPNIGKVFPRYTGKPRSTIGIRDVINIGAVYPGSNADPLSQRPGYMGSPLPGFGLS